MISWCSLPIHNVEENGKRCVRGVREITVFSLLMICNRTFSTRVSCARWQSQVTDTQSRQAGEKEKSQRSCKEADALQPPVRSPLPAHLWSWLNEVRFQIRKCHNSSWQAENVGPFFLVLCYCGLSSRRVSRCARPTSLLV